MKQKNLKFYRMNYKMIIVKIIQKIKCNHLNFIINKFKIYLDNINLFFKLQY